MNKVETVRITTKTPARIIWPAITKEARDLKEAQALKAGNDVENVKGGLEATFDPGDATIAELMAIAASMGKEAFGLSKVTKKDLFAHKGEVNFPFKDANNDKILKNKKGDERPFFKDKYLLAAKVYGNDYPSVVYDPSGQGKWELTDAKKIYSGCYAYLVLDFFATEKKGNKSICCGLKSIAFAHDGERVGGSGYVDPTEAFKSVQGAAVAIDPRRTEDDDLNDEIPFGQKFGS